MVKFKHDIFKKHRGGRSKLLEITCASCGQHICLYQKDGQGILKRMYFDRIFESKEYSDLKKESLKQTLHFICPTCKKVIGIPYIYKKEQRPAFRLIAGSVNKKIVIVH